MHVMKLYSPLMLIFVLKDSTYISENYFLLLKCNKCDQIREFVICSFYASVCDAALNITEQTFV